MRCFFHDSIPVADAAFQLNYEESRHLFKTLRASSGDSVEIIDGKGQFAIAEVIDNKSLVIKSVMSCEPPQPKLHLFLAPPKRQKMDILLKQCAELGVDSINTFISENSVSKPEKNSINERWQQLLIEGCKQSKNPFLPEINHFKNLDYAMANITSSCDLAFFGGFSESSQTSLPETHARNIAWVIGPEGGFSHSEIESLKQSGILELSIGRCVLRAETAAIAGLSILGFNYCQKQFTQLPNEGKPSTQSSNR